MKKKYLANCLCGGVKIKITGKLSNVSNCHCSQCMKTHGNFGSYTSCENIKLFFIKKKSLRWYKSSSFAKRGFCYKCGASLFFKRLKSERISISAGIFNNPTKLKTNRNIFTKGKMDYYKLNKKIPKFNEYPK
tara:strand:- start:507 stop:905 length:399 start_codon:yes stop_codon:yes gene_type:complete